MKSKNKKTNKKVVPLKSVFFVNDVLSSYYRMLRKIKPGETPVAYVNIGFPKQVLYSMGVIPVYPQFHAGFQSARGKAKHILKYVEDNHELPHDICGEVKAAIGTALLGDSLAFQLPKPDMVIGNNSYCLQAAKGFKFLSTRLKIPYYFCDFPCTNQLDENSRAVTYALAQIEQFAKEIQKEFHTEFNPDKLKSSIHKDFRVFVVWREIMKLCSLDPAPVDAMDLNIFLLPFYTIDSENDVVLNMMIDLYNNLSKQYLNREMTGEKEYRLLWDLLPVYHKKDFFQALLSRYNATVVTSTFFFGSSYYLNTLDPWFQYPLTKEKVIEKIETLPPVTLEDGIRFFMQADSKHPLQHKKEKMKNMIRDFKIDAVVLHMDRSCRPISLTQYELMHYIEKELNVPVLLFDADSMDERYFSKSQVATRVEAFMENLPPKAQKKQGIVI